MVNLERYANKRRTRGSHAKHRVSKNINYCNLSTFSLFNFFFF